MWHYAASTEFSAINPLAFDLVILTKFFVKFILFRGDSLAKDPKMIPMSLVEKNVTRKKKIAPRYAMVIRMENSPFSVYYFIVGYLWV